MKIACQANCDGVAERFADPAVHKSIAGDWALITYDDEWLSGLQWSIVKNATPDEADTCYGSASADASNEELGSSDEAITSCSPP